MAAWLTLLRTRLLLPEAAAQADATALQQRLADRDAARRLADWLEPRPQLGRDMFGRGKPEPAADAQPAADLTARLRACLTLLALPQRDLVYRPQPPDLWRVPDALARIRSLLAGLELSRDGAVVLQQDTALREVREVPGPPGNGNHATRHPIAA